MSRCTPETAELFWHTIRIRTRKSEGPDRNEGRRTAMKMNYYFAQLSRHEREFLEMVLLEEMDIQRWYSVAFSSVFGGEIFLTLQ